MHAHAEEVHELHWAISVEPEHSVRSGSEQKVATELSAKTVAAVNVRIPVATTAISDGYATPESAATRTREGLINPGSSKNRTTSF